jgi:hypothetical protein
LDPLAVNALNAYGYSNEWRRDDWRRVEREREFRRAEEYRRWQWQRDHYRPYGGYGYYGR